MEQQEDIRSRILLAAGNRFQRFGFGKTTMAEIAADCEMSAGNLYRYFENKDDIGTAISIRCMTDREADVRAVVRQPGLSPEERLERFVVTLGTSIHDAATSDIFTNEMVDRICAQRFDLVENHLQTIVSLIGEVLAQGNESGAFDIDDVMATARTVKSACKGFLYPPLVAMCSREEIEQDAIGVARLIIRGLAKR